MIQGVPPAPPVPPPPPFDPNLIFLNDTGAPLLVTIVALSLLAATVILWPIMRALGRRLEGRGSGEMALRGEVEQLQQRVGDMEALQFRVQELEERLDFAERLLTRGEPDRLER